MPINKRESLLFTFIMCFCMVLWMSIYNVALQHGAINGEVVAAAWLGFPVAYVFAMCCDWFIASPSAKGFAFKFLVTPGKSSPLAMTLAVSSCMVVPMVIIMSLYGACEGLFHMPGGPLANLQALPMMWLVNIPRNFIRACPGTCWWPVRLPGLSSVAPSPWARSLPSRTWSSCTCRVLPLPRRLPTFPRAWTSSLPARQRSEPDPQTDRSDSFFVDVVVWLRAEKVPTVNIYSIWVKRPKRCRGAALCV